MERTIKVVLISTGSKAGYGYSAWRVVECRVDQRGYKSERGVTVLWESEDLYRPTSKVPRSKGYKARQRAERIAEETRQYAEKMATEAREKITARKKTAADRAAFLARTIRISGEACGLRQDRSQLEMSV